MKHIVGNWKMFPSSQKEAKAIFVGIKKEIVGISRTKVVLCPPAIFVTSMVEWKAKSKIAIGAQNCFKDDEGARTGETSPKALASIGASYVILGHSERRALGETDVQVAEKVVAAVRNKLTVVLCVGEHERDQHGSYFSEVSNQLRASLSGFPKGEAKRLVIAYEPIWAIGAKAKQPATPSDYREMSILMRRYLTEYFGKKVAFAIPILYGGSVDDRNAEGFLKDGGADGLLVGRISLDAEKFTAIIHIANKLR